MTRISATVKVTMAAVMVGVLTLLAASAAVAQGTSKEVTHVIVLPVVDRTQRQSTAVLDKATAAVALALEDSGEFTVASTSDLAREMDALGLRFPLNKAEQLRLARRLHADKVINSYLHRLVVNTKTGAGEARLEVQALDVVAEEVIAGGIGRGFTMPVPGWAGDELTVINELLRQAAEEAVRDMLKRRVPRGMVEMIDDLGLVHVNLGLRDGVAVGQELVVMRGYWQRELERTIMRKIGVVRVAQVASDRLTATVVSGMPPRTGDRVYVLYRPVEVQKAVKRRKKITQSTRLLAALGLIAGIVATATGKHRYSAPAGRAAMAQGLSATGAIAPGQTPTIRIVNILGRPVPDPSREIKGYIIFRGESPFIDTDDPENIVYVSGNPRLRAWDDDMTARAEINATKEWTYIGRGGDEEDASYDITYNHRPLEPGHTYYYRVRRIVSPYEAQVPIATQQARGVGTAQGPEYVDAEWEFEPNMDAVLSGPSDPLGPVTYVLPAVLRDPRDGLTTVNPREITFVWDLQTPPSAGPGAADARYVLLVFRANNLNHPIYRSEPMRPTASTMTKVVRDPDGHIFKPDTEYVWMVGHYVEGEPEPLTPLGLVLSSQFYFRTVAVPPAPTSVGAARGGERVPVRRGWLGETRTPR